MDRSSKSQLTRTPWLLSLQAVESLSHATSPWTARSAALVSLVPCAKAVGEDQSRADALSKQIQSLSQPMAICVSDLRSAIVRQSCEAIQSLASALGPKLADAAGSDLMPALIRRASTRKLVMRESASMAATALLNHGAQGVSKSVLLNITASIMERSAPAPVRAAASRYLGLLLQKDCPSITEVGRQIGNAIQSGCSDADDSVRASSRDNLRHLRTLDQTRYEEIFDSLERKVQALVVDSNLPNKTPRRTPVHRPSIISSATNVYPARRVIPSRNTPMLPAVVPRASVAKPSTKIPTLKKEEETITFKPPVTKAKRPTLPPTGHVARRPSEYKAFSARRRETIEKQVRDREGSKNLPVVGSMGTEKVVRKRLAPRSSTLPPKCPPVAPPKPTVLPPLPSKKSAILELPVRDTVKHLAVSSGSRKRAKAPISRASVGASRTRPVSKISRRPTGIPRVTKPRGSMAASKSASLKPRLSVPVAPAATRPWNLPPPKLAASKPRTFRRSMHPAANRGGSAALLRNGRKPSGNGIKNTRQANSIGVFKQNAAYVSIKKDLSHPMDKENQLPVEKADKEERTTKETSTSAKVLQSTTSSSSKRTQPTSQNSNCFESACEDNSNGETPATNDVKTDCQVSQPAKSPMIQAQSTVSATSRRLSESGDSSHVPKVSEGKHVVVSNSTESAPLLTLDKILEESSSGSILTSSTVRERKSISNSFKLRKSTNTSAARKSMASSTHSSRTATAKAHSRPFTVGTSTSRTTGTNSSEVFALSELLTDSLEIATPKKRDSTVKKNSISFLLGSDTTPKATIDNSDAVSETAENNQVQVRLRSSAQLEDSNCASPQSHSSAVSASNFKSERVVSLPKRQFRLSTPKTLAKIPSVSPPQTLAKTPLIPPPQRLSTASKASAASAASPLQGLPPLTSRTLLARRASAAHSSFLAPTSKGLSTSKVPTLKRASRVIRAPPSSNASLSSRPSIASDAIVESSKRKSSLGTPVSQTMTASVRKTPSALASSSVDRKSELKETDSVNRSTKSRSKYIGNTTLSRNESTGESRESATSSRRTKVDTKIKRKSAATIVDKENVTTNARPTRARLGEGRRFGQDLTMRQSVMNGEEGESYEAQLQKSNVEKDKLTHAFACASESRTKQWEERLAALGQLTKVFSSLENAKVENVERVADELAKYICDVHVKVVASGLDAAFDLFLTAENTTLLFEALERHPLLIRGIIGLLHDKRELARLAAQRAIQSFGAIFPGAQQLALLARAHEKGNTSRLASESKILLDVLERTMDVTASPRTLDALTDVAAMAREHRKETVRRCGFALSDVLREKFASV